MTTYDEYLESDEMARKQASSLYEAAKEDETSEEN